MKDWTALPAGSPFVASFSGGKDSVLALYHASRSARPLGLITMFDGSGRHSGAHGLSPDFISAQAGALRLPVRFGCAAWGEYERVFTGLLSEFKSQGALVLVTGDLELPEENCWHARVAANAGLALCAPLWHMEHAAEARAFIAAGFTAVVVCVNTKMGMRDDDLGRFFDQRFVDELIVRGIDPSAEAGEFHTAVVDGPLFCRPLRYLTGAVRIQGEYRLLDLEI